MATDTANWVGMTLCDGRYRVIRKLGEGGMAHVYVARDDKLERDVVIKAPRSNLIVDPTFAGRFNREVRSLARLSHAHIVPLIDIGQHDGFPFAVLQLLTGGSLRDRQPRTAEGNLLPMTPTSLASWLPAVGQALDFIHKTKYVHRDIKPENILFDEEGQVFLSDLGVIKALADQDSVTNHTVYTGAGMVLGTPHYMAPELILGDTIDGRVDQYALAVTLFEVLTGQLPFTGTNAAAIFVQHTTKPAPSMREVFARVPAGLAAAIDRGLAKVPRDRYANCSEFCQAVLAGSGVAMAAQVSDSSPGTYASTPPPRTAKVAESPPLRVETPSDMKNITGKSPKPRQGKRSSRSGTVHESAPKPAAVATLLDPPKRSRAGLYVSLAALFVVASMAAGYFLIRPGTSQLKLIAVPPVALAPGETRSIAVEVDRANLDGEITCWIEGLPDGISTPPLFLPAGDTRGKIELSVPLGARASKNNPVLKAKCNNLQVSTSFELVIRDAASGISIAPLEPITLKAGDKAEVTVSVERRNCQGAISLTVESLPQGVSWVKAAVDLGELAPHQTTYPLTLRASPGMTEYKGDITIIARMKDQSDAKQPVSLTVVGAKKSTAPPITPNPETPPVTARLRLIRPIDRTLQPGARITASIEIEHAGITDPIIINVTGLPQGVTMAPASPLTMLPGSRFVSFDLIAADTARPVKSLVNVSAQGGGLNDSATYSVSILARPTTDPYAGRAILVSRKGQLLGGTPALIDSFPLTPNKQYVLELKSTAFDCALEIRKDGRSVASDDNTGGGTNARIVFTPTEFGLYELIATSKTPSGSGEYELTIR